MKKLIIILLLASTSLLAQNKKYYALGVGVTGVYADLLQGGSWAFYTENLYIGANFNTSWKGVEVHNQEYLIGFNSRKLHYTHNIFFKKIPSFDVYATFYGGFHNIQGYSNNLSMGTRLNLIFKDIPIGFYIDANKEARMAYGLIIDFNHM